MRSFVLISTTFLFLSLNSCHFKIENDGEGYDKVKSTKEFYIFDKEKSDSIENNQE